MKADIEKAFEKAHNQLAERLYDSDIEFTDDERTELAMELYAEQKAIEFANKMQEKKWFRRSDNEYGGFDKNKQYTIKSGEELYKEFNK